MQSEYSCTARAGLAEAAVIAKRRKDLTWDQIAEGTGLNVAFVTTAILGNHPLPAAAAELVGKRLELSADDISLLQSVPMRGRLEIPSDPTLYRFHEMMQVYGPALKALVHERFGDGIVSAINFRMSIDKEADPEGGERVVIMLNGKFLPVKPY
ncbi:cyanase [Bradyrhizobium sp. B124]|uniref:cyanase n=1 Tax=Bradyrhizobium sp. B124 TaxID=3140245 RepID=UPI0031835D54